MKLNHRVALTALAVSSVLAFLSSAQAATEQDKVSSAILFQGFHWNSANGNWYADLQSKAADLKTLGITHVWFPPPSDAASKEGYLPRQLNKLDSNYGNEPALTAATSALAAQGIKSIADVVVNHRVGSAGWGDFTNPTWDCRAVVNSDEWTGKCGNADTGDGYADARDIDHTQTFVQSDIKAWLSSRLKGAGFTGIRFDYSKGYGANYAGMYQDAMTADFCVGEVWTNLNYDDVDAHRKLLMNYVDGASGKCGAFDFTTKGLLNQAIAYNEYYRLKDSAGKPAGGIGWWAQKMVTFVDNHDTGPSESCAVGQNHWPVPCDKVMQGYAYVLTHPGVPSVYYAHVYNWGLKNDIKALIDARKAAGITSTSSVSIQRATTGLYAAIVTGTNYQLAMKIGPNAWDPGSGWMVVASGTNYAVWKNVSSPTCTNNVPFTITNANTTMGGSCSALPPSESTTLGADWSATKTVFSLWSPDKTDVKLLLDGVPYPMKRVADYNGYTDVYQVSVADNQHLKKYSFLVNGVSVRDPYGKMVEPNTNNDIVMDMSTTALAAGWVARPALPNREDAIIYETHVRDFTISANSGISTAKKGKFLGMVEAGTTFKGVKTGLDHLEELGVTHVQLMPVSDFGSCGNVNDTTCYNWGYDPRNYNVPDERYSLTPFDYVNRAKEFKQMVDAFHKADIRVVLDVVYNHTFEKEMFDPITSKYYTETDLSLTGNSIDADQPMVSRMIQDSLEYWAREYNIDGFRLDLIGIFSYAEVQKWAGNLNTKFPDRNLLIYGEPWNGGASDPKDAQRLRLGTVGRIWNSHVGVFNPKFRDAIKGENNHGGCKAGDCFAFNANPDTWRIEVGSRGAIRATKDASIVIDHWDPMFAMDPEQTINYASAHDNLTLRDKVLAWSILNGVTNAGYLRRIQDFANGMVLTAQGIPFLHSGEELLRTKGGNVDSYRSPDSVNQINWQWKVDNADTFAYYKQMVNLRKTTPALRLTTWDAINNCVQTARPRYGVVVNTISGCGVTDAIVIENSADSYTHTLPAGTWTVKAEKSDASIAPRAVSGSVVAEGTAVTVLTK